MYIITFFIHIHNKLEIPVFVLFLFDTKSETHYISGNQTHKWIRESAALLYKSNCL